MRRSETGHNDTTTQRSQAAKSLTLPRLIIIHACSGSSIKRSSAVTSCALFSITVASSSQAVALSSVRPWLNIPEAMRGKMAGWRNAYFFSHDAYTMAPC